MQLTLKRWWNGLARQVFNKKQQIQTSKWSLLWAFCNLTIALGLYLDIEQGSVARFMDPYFSAVFYLEAVFGLVLMVNFVTNVCLYFMPIIDSPTEVHINETKLFNVHDDDLGFKIVRDSPKTSSPKQSTPATDKSLLLRSSFMLPSARANTSSPGDSVLSLNSTSPNVSVTSSSWQFMGNSGGQSGNKSVLAITPKEKSDNEQLRRRTQRDTSALEWSIDNDRSLNEFLTECEIEERKQAQVWNSVKASDSPSQGSASVAGGTFGTDIKRFFMPKYQAATRSPASATATATTDSSFQLQTSTMVDSSVSSLDLPQLIESVEGLRKWFSVTILESLVKEIDKLNTVLGTLGSSELQIGQASTLTLRQMLASRCQVVPHLGTLIPFLEITTNQSYLVTRLRDLAKGGALSEYCWNGGATTKDCGWTEQLPTDAELLMHWFCCYMDSQLPLDPRYPDGKTFTKQFFQKLPKTLERKSDSLQIIQSQERPPHYQVLIGTAVVDPAKGRNNLFFALLHFLQNVRQHRDGMLGQISLGLSGLNMLWILDAKKSPTKLVTPFLISSPFASSRAAK